MTAAHTTADVATAALTDLLARYARAVAGKDLAAFCALYTEDVVVFDPFDSWTLSGLADWRAATAAWFAALGDAPMTVTHRQVQAQVNFVLRQDLLPAHLHHLKARIHDLCLNQMVNFPVGRQSRR